MSNIFILVLAITISYPVFVTATANYDDDVIDLSHKPTLKVDNHELVNMSKESKKKIDSDQLKSLDAFIRQEKKKSYLRKKLALGLPDKYDDNYVYSEMVRSFQSRDAERLELLLVELLKQFPQSIHADNALVLVGQMNLSFNRSAEALNQFEQTIKDYPLGNKVPAALLGKAIAYKNLKLYKYAESALDNLKKDYPGSPESLRAELEKRVIEVEANNKGRSNIKSVN